MILSPHPTRVNHPSIFEVLEKTPGSSQVEEVERKHIMRARKILLQEFQTNQFRKSDKYERSSKRKETSNLYEEGDYVLAQFMGDAPKFSGKALFFGPGCIAKLQGQEAEIFWPHLGRTSIRNTNNLIHFALPSGGIQRSDFQNMPRITKMQNGRMISKVSREEILRNLEEGKYKNAFLNLRSELDFIETEIESISLFELQDFRKEYYSCLLYTSPSPRDS